MTKCSMKEAGRMRGHMMGKGELQVPKILFAVGELQFPKDIICGTETYPLVLMNFLVLFWSILELAWMKSSDTAFTVRMFSLKRTNFFP
jgi:hypothetical protein